MQYNFISKQDYQGQNQVDLMIAKDKNGYTSDAWLTFLQAKQVSRKIKKGEHGVGVFKGFGSFTDAKETK